MSQPNFRSLYLFRVIDGKRVRYRLTVDAAMTVIDERPAEDPTLPAVSAKYGPHLQEMQQRGVEFRLGPQGQLIVDKMPESEKMLYKFFSPLTPCWFGGCEELRAQYTAEVEALGGENCPDCRNGEVIRRYLPKVRELLQEHYGSAAQNHDTRVEGRVS